MDAGAIVVGAGHNGLICAAYLQRAGISTVVVEARETIGGCSATDNALGGALVNICNCDHAMVRTTSIPDELALGRHGLQYLNVEPAYLNVHWDGGPGWFLFHDVDRTLASLQHSYPGEVAGYERYLRSALPVVRTVTELAQATPTPGAIFGGMARRAKYASRAVPTILQWSKRSVGDVVRSFFAAEAVRSPVISTGPSVWGLSPETPGTGLGALGYAMRHHAPVGRPVGGSGALPGAIASALLAAGGTVRTNARVSRILCEGGAVVGVELAGGEVIRAPIVVAATDPRLALVDWLSDPPASAAALIAKYRDAPVHDGYEAKIDAVIDAPYDIPAVDDAMRRALSLTDEQVRTPSMIVSNSLAQLAVDHAAQLQGRIAERPQFFVQLPSVLDPSVGAALPVGHQVFSLEILWTPYALAGGWDATEEPRRWLTKVSELVTMADGRPFHDHVVDYRLMGPREYEREFSMVRGHAPAFSGTPITALLGRNRELSRYETPVKGLFLTGAATFPGAGIWGASGRNTATAVLASDGRSARARRSVSAAVA